MSARITGLRAVLAWLVLGTLMLGTTVLAESPMISVVATIKVKPGMEQEFEAVAKQLVAKVNANEPECKLYTLSKTETPQTYVFMERYVDQEAVKAHRASEYFKELGGKMRAFMDGPPQLLRMTKL